MNTETFPRRRPGMDAAVAVAVAGVGGVGHLLAAPQATWWGVGSVVVGGLALAVRRSRPIAVLAVTTLTSAGSYLAGEVHQGPFLMLPVLVALSTATARGHRRRATAAGALVAVALLAGLAIPGRVVDPLGVVWGLGWVVAAVVAGEVVRERRAYLDEVEARAAEAERTREEEARRRAGQERLRIARELHDSVAHSISTINVQAGVAAHLLDSHPDQARPALLAIRQASQDALEELRATLGVLRRDDPDGGPAPRGPAPGLDRLDELVDQTTAAGLPVQVTVEGAPAALPDRVDLAAYRIVQESLTNVLRHGGEATATVHLAYTDGALTVQVDDDGRGCDGPVEAGHGLIGMEERAVATGGRLEAGPRPEGGFRVRAHLPTEPEGAGR